jgi:hypothetical protein
MKLIDHYYEWMKTGLIKDLNKSRGKGGLCNAIPRRYMKSIELLEPDDNNWKLYWGSEEYRSGPTASLGVMYSFTPLRQNIVLFICAIHGEI